MIKDIKELEKLLKMCRKQGVTELTIEGASFKLGDLPIKGNDVEAVLEDPQSEEDLEDLTFYSVSGAQ